MEKDIVIVGEAQTIIFLLNFLLPCQSPDEQSNFVNVPFIKS